MHECIDAISATDWASNSARIGLGIGAAFVVVFAIGLVAIWRTFGGGRAAPPITIAEAIETLKEPQPVPSMPGAWARYEVKPVLCDGPNKKPIRVAGESENEAAVAERKMRRAR